jgi:hypothetical protein
MANHTARKLALLLTSGLMLTLVGCGRGVPTALSAVDRAKPSVAAKGVAPDHENVLGEDIRRARYWQADAQLVMAIHATALNTTKISASGNVFYSQEAFLAGQPCVFVARHYGFRPIAQYTESVDFARLAGRLAVIGKYAVKAEDAWRIAKSYQPAPAPTPTPIPGAPQAMHDPAPAKANAPIWSSRAVLLQPEGKAAQWYFYAQNKVITIDAETKAVLDATPRINPNDRLNTGFDVDVQRAAIAWLPTSRGGDNIITEPKATN